MPRAARVEPLCRGVRGREAGATAGTKYLPSCLGHDMRLVPDDGTGVGQLMFRPRARTRLWRDRREARLGRRGRVPGGGWLARPAAAMREELRADVGRALGWNACTTAVVFSANFYSTTGRLAATTGDASAEKLFFLSGRFAATVGAWAA